MNNNKNFLKPPLSVAQQLNLLVSRGLIVNDESTAVHYLKFISYYRFCGYGIEFEDNPFVEEKRYRKGTTFEQVLDCYIFDRKLRLLVIDAIERIEVAIRTVITNELALKYGAHWYLNKKLFLEKFKYEELIETIKKETFYRAQDGSIQHKKRERFLQHYFSKYSDPELPPIWMVAEVLSLGTWSNIFANLINRVDQKMVCKHFGINYGVMASWLHSLTYLRNLCAHHSMLWNRNFTLKPLIANNYHRQLKNNSRLAAQVAILKIFLDIISPDNDWSNHLLKLTQEHPAIDITRMGFVKDWQADPFWGINDKFANKLLLNATIKISPTLNPST